jgi:tetratricopeptide (TPR) repeat protein
MPSKTRALFVLVALLAVAGGAWWWNHRDVSDRPAQPGPTAERAPASQLARHRILASVHYINSRLEDPKHREEILRAVGEAEECVRLAPDSATDALNLAICYLRQFDERRFESPGSGAASQPSEDWVAQAKPLLAKAIGLIETARRKAPSLAAAHFHAAMAQIRRAKIEASVESSDWKAQFLGAAKDYLSIEDRSSAVRYHLGVTEFKDGKYKDAEVSLRRAVEIDPNHPNAYYTLGQALARQGDPGLRAEATRIFERHKQLQESIGKARAEWDPDAVFDFAYPELLPAGDNVSAGTIAGAVQFERIEGPAGETFATPVLLGDAANVPDAISQSGRPEETARASALVFGSGEPALWNISASSLNIQKGLGLGAGRPAPVAAVQGDFDGDHALDLMASDLQSIVLLRQKGVARSAGFESLVPQGLEQTPGVASLFAADLDSDGDLDLVAAQNTAGRHAIRIFRNDAEPVPAPEDTPAENLQFRPKFMDISDTARVAAPAGNLVRVVPLDFDRGNDTDLLVAADGGSALYANRRNFSFQKLADLPAALDAAAGDLDGDGATDAVLANANGLFVVNGQPAMAPSAPTPREIVKMPLASPRIEVADLENRGWLDIVCISENRISVWRNRGGGQFVDVGPALFPAGFAGTPRSMVIADLDGDFDLDVIAMPAAGPTSIYINRGGEARPAAALMFRGTKTNRAGIGSKVEARVGGARLFREVWSIPAYVAAGGATRIDGLFLKWTNGIDEAEGGVPLGRYKFFTEKRGREGSCPFVYSWDGEKFIFVTDAIGATPLGLFAAPGMYVPPQDREWLRMTDRQLKPRGGFYELRFTEEMREVTYLDAVSLMCIDHPAGTSVYPDERFSFPPFAAKRLLRVRTEVPVRSARDGRGLDATELLLSEDRRFVKPPERIGYQGVCTEHSLELDLGDIDTTRPVRLFLTGWFAWTNSSINKAIAEAGIRFSPPRIEALGSGGWRTIVEDAGFPAGMQKTMCIDLSGKLQKGEHVVRLVTNLALYWDRAFLSFDDDREGGAGPFEPSVHVLRPTSAELRWRGASRWRAPQGLWPTEPVYDQFTGEAVYDLHVGNYTKYGDVLPLLQNADDQFVLFHHGDEVALAFRADDAPPVPPGMQRTYFLDSSGWAKDMDPNTFAPGTVEPLPFHGMSGYPYSDKERYPSTTETSNYQKNWNTRRVERPRILPACAGIEAIHEK